VDLSFAMDNELYADRMVEIYVQASLAIPVAMTRAVASTLLGGRAC
jgi:hypothetical protein